MRKPLPWALASGLFPPLLAGCSATVIPPEGVQDPRPVFILDHGRHSTLVVTTSQGTMVRYAYGDWCYYARNQTGIGDGLRALLWPTQGALGRRELPGPPTPAGVRRGVRVVIRKMVRVTVESERVAALRRGLDALVTQQRGNRLVNRRYDLVFAPHPEPYSLANHSNGKVAEWLEALDVEVSGWPLWSRWQRERDAPPMPVQRAPKGQQQEPPLAGASAEGAGAQSKTP